MKLIAFIFASCLATNTFAQNTAPTAENLAHQVCTCAQQANLVEMEQQSKMQKNEQTGRGLQASLQKTLECMGANTISKQLGGLDYTARKKYEQDFTKAMRSECPQVEAILYRQ